MKKWPLILALSLPVFAQVSVTPISRPYVTFVDAAGLPCAQCTLTTDAAGTTMPLATYTDSTGTSTNTNPIVLDAAGGHQIWFGPGAYKLILKSFLGATIWTVDNVKGGGGLGNVCGPAGAIQIANSGVNGFDCDASITINKTAHTLNVGTLPTNHVTIGPLGTPTLWTFDTTSPATACTSIGCTSDGSGTTTPNLLAISTSVAHVLAYSTSIPPGITAITASPSDNSTKPATTAYVQSPGAIAPTTLALNAGTAMTGNQGAGLLLQHSTGSPVTDDCVKFDSFGNTVDTGIPCPTPVVTPVARTCNSNGCYRISPDGTIEEWGVSGPVPTGADQNVVSITFPFALANLTNASLTAVSDGCVDTCGSTTPKNPVGFSMVQGTLTTSGVTFNFTGVTPTGGGGGTLTATIHAHWHLIQ